MGFRDDGCIGLESSDHMNCCIGLESSAPKWRKVFPDQVHMVRWYLARIGLIPLSHFGHLGKGTLEYL